MKTYEAMLLLDNREVKKGWEPLKENLDGILARHGAEIVVAKRWDERKLAFDIHKQRRATYYLAYFKSAPDRIAELRRDLDLSGPVLRFLILNCEEIPKEAYEPEREFHLVDEPEAAEETPAEEAATEEAATEEAGAETSNPEATPETATDENKE